MSHVPVGAWDMFNISSLLKCQQRSSSASLTILKRGTEECLVHKLTTKFIFQNSCKKHKSFRESSTNQRIKLLYMSQDFSLFVSSVSYSRLFTYNLHLLVFYLFVLKMISYTHKESILFLLPSTCNESSIIKTCSDIFILTLQHNLHQTLLSCV